MPTLSWFRPLQPWARLTASAAVIAHPPAPTSTSGPSIECSGPLPPPNAAGSNTTTWPGGHRFWCSLRALDVDGTRRGHALPLDDPSAQPEGERHREDNRKCG